MVVSTPLNPDTLVTHPDQALVRYILAGLHKGFRIGFQRGSPLRSTRDNLPSAQLHPEVIRDYLWKECRLGRMLGPYDNVLPCI